MVPVSLIINDMIFIFIVFILLFLIMAIGAIVIKFLMPDPGLKKAFIIVIMLSIVAILIWVFLRVVEYFSYKSS